MSSNNNSTDIIVKGSILQEREEEDYPDPTTLPSPTQEPRIIEGEVTLSELVPRKYVSTTARVVYRTTITNYPLTQKAYTSSSFENIENIENTILVG